MQTFSDEKTFSKDLVQTLIAQLFTHPQYPTLRQSHYSEWKINFRGLNVTPISRSISCIAVSTNKKVCSKFRECALLVVAGVCVSECACAFCVVRQSSARAACCRVRTHLAPAANPAGCLCHDVSLGTRKSPQCLHSGSLPLRSQSLRALCWLCKSQFWPS